MTIDQGALEGAIQRVRDREIATLDLAIQIGIETYLATAVTREALAPSTSAATRGEPVAWSLIWNEQYGVNTETTFKTEEEAARYAGRCLTSAKPRVVALYDHPVPAVESAQVTDVEDAILACERGNTVYDVLANYRAVRRTIQDIRASLATDAEG